MATTSKTLREERKKIHETMQAMVLSAEQEGRGLRAEERERFDKMKDEIDSLLDQAEGLERIEHFKGNQLQELTTKKNSGKFAPSMPSPSTRHQYNRALKGWLASTCNDLQNEWPGWTEYAATADQFGYKGERIKYLEAPFDTTVTHKGLETLPLTLAAEIDERLKSFGGVFGVAEKINTSDGGPFRIITADTTSVLGAQVAQNAADNITEFTLGEKSLSTYLYSSGIIKIPFEAIRDSKYDIQKYVAKWAALAVNRKFAPLLLTGTGSGEPLGLLDATNGLQVGFYAGTTLSYSDIEHLIYSVDDAYHNGAKFLMSPDFRRELMTMTSTIGQPLWQPSLVAGEPDTYRGYPIVTDYGMDTFGVGSTPVAFGNFEEAYVVRQVGTPTLATSDQRYFEFRQIAVVYHMSLDATVVDKNAAKTMKFNVGS